MGIFNYKNFSEEKSKGLFADALAMTTYTYHNLDSGLANGYQHTGFGIGLPMTLLTALVGNSQSQGIFPGIPFNPDSEKQALDKVNNAGWSVISAEQLGYQGKTDHRGTYFGEQPGYKSAQAEVLGKYDSNGKLLEIGIAFRGTSGPRESLISDTISDAIHDIMLGIGPKEFAENYIFNTFDKLLGDVARFAQANGLTGENILISGHSLGGMATNNMASHSEKHWGGFYSDSNYISFASPTQHEGDGKVLNIGYENDPVFRTLNGTEFNPSSLGVHDKPHESATNNIVNFNDYYASDLWNLLPQSLLNIASWLAHMPFAYEDGLYRVVDSEFYSMMSKDSTVIVSNLSDVKRGHTWVEDINRYAEKHTGPTFIVGSDGNDLIQGGRGNDYLEGRDGNDIFRDNGGFNVIAGGKGNNVFDTQTALKKTQVAFDGETLYLRDSNGGITIADDIGTLRSKEKIGIFGLLSKTVDYQVTEAGLKNGNSVISYASAQTGGDGADTLQAKAGDAWLFGNDGDDILIGHQNGNLTFVGGNGDDTLQSAGKNNTLLFGGNFGKDQVLDFGSSDKLVIFASQDKGSDFHNYLTQHNDDVVFTFGENQITLVGLSLDHLADNQVVLV